MKLTNAMRDGFVASAMQDVPTIDFDEQLRKATLAASLKALPVSVRKIYEELETRPFLETAYRRIGGITVTVPGYERYGQGVLPALDKKTIDALEAIGQQLKSQKANREDLSRKLRSAAYAVNTRKALAELLPEFEKYLPADQEAANRMLPVVANLVADFSKAGWPKGKKLVKASA